MLKHMFHFSFQSLFPDKEFSEDEIEFCKRIVKKLMEDEKIKGEFDEEDLSFSCTDLLFAKNYTDLLEGFTTMVTKIFSDFETTLSKIKRILLNRKEAIRPHGIINIENLLKAVRSQLEFLRNDIAITTSTANKRLREIYKDKSEEEKNKMKKFEKYPQVIKLTNQFREWVSLFNALEFKCGSIIFYQKRLEREPENKNAQKELEKLLSECRMV